MDYRNRNNIDPWDEGVFGTGNTSPPKNHSGIIALLLILVIFLSGIISLLSFMNIRLFRELAEQSRQLQEESPMAFSELEIQNFTDPAQVPEDHHLQGDVSISLHQSPQSVDNVPEPGAMSWQDIYQKNISSVVTVLTTNATGSVQGNGIVVSEQGFLITTFCTVDSAETITVTLYDGSSCSALMVGADPVTDLAVLYVDVPGLIPAEFGDSGALRVGDPVAAMAAQLGGTLSNGIISAIGRDVRFLGKDLSLIQSNVALSPAGAGGPLINCYGQVIGINVGHLSTEADAQGFAIPSSTVKQIVDQLIAHGYVSGRPTLGLSGDTVTAFDQAYFHIPQGLYLSAVEPDSDAFRLGIEPGDILVSLGGEIITSQPQLDTLVNSMTIGDEITAVFFRAGEELTVTLTVTEYTG
jgi:serine protease Do